MKGYSRCLLLILGSVVFCDSLSAQSWVDSSFSDFSKGELDASGQNLYISKKGDIRSIRRYDLNQDGYIDLLFNSTHDFANDPPSVLASFSKSRGIKVDDLDVFGSLSCEVIDLNKDGHNDLIFCPSATGLQHPRRFISIIYGGQDGWPKSRTHGLLPVDDPVSISVADINNDGWDDIAVLCKDGKTGSRIVKAFWGSPHGFTLTSFYNFHIDGLMFIESGDFKGTGEKHVITYSTDGSIHLLLGEEVKKIAKLSHNDITGLFVGDVDNDKQEEVLLTTKNNEIITYKSSLEKKLNKTHVIKGVKANQLSIADLDGDGFADIVYTNFEIQQAAGGEMIGGKVDNDSGIKVLWGSSVSFRVDNMTTLSIPYAKYASVGDFDGDRKPDIAVAVYQVDNKFDAQSRVFFGKGNRNFELSSSGIPSAGGNHVAVIRGRREEGDLLVVSNTISGTTYEKVPLLLYYGSEQGFNKENVVKIPFASGYEATAADLNEDGKVDIVAVNSMHGGDLNDPYGGVNIIWGDKKNGQSQTTFENRTILNEVNASTSNVADLNKDGYLDIIIGFFDRMDKKPTNFVIYYGNESGYDTTKRQVIACEGRSSSPMVVDINKDGWLDIVVNSYSKDKIRIFWGGKDGFHEDKRQDIPVVRPIDIEVADLNGDGFLDIIVCHYKDNPNNHHDMGMSILWGSEKGYSNWNAQWLPGYTPLGPVVADFDGDGFLDIFAPAYHGDNMRGQIAMYLYWGSKGGFSKKNRKVFIGDSGSDALAADFNKDGLLDLAIANHTNGPDHGAAISQIYYNDGERFESKTIQVEEVPSAGTHWMWNKDMGHIYDRSWKQHYTSRVFEWRKMRDRVLLHEDALLIGASKLEAYVRSAPTKEALLEAPWEPFSGENAVDLKDRFLQYRYVFVSDNGDAYPILKSVAVTLQ